MEQNAKKKISCGGFMLGEGLVLSEDGKTLSVSGGGLPSDGEPYQQLVTDAYGNARWATVNSVIYRDSSGNLSVDSCMKKIDGSPASIENMMCYGSISLIDDVNGVVAPCIRAFDSGSGYDILTFMSITESSPTTIKIKVVGGTLADDKISILE